MPNKIVRIIVQENVGGYTLLASHQFAALELEEVNDPGELLLRRYKNLKGELNDKLRQITQTPPKPHAPQQPHSVSLESGFDQCSGK